MFRIDTKIGKGNFPVIIRHRPGLDKNCVSLDFQNLLRRLFHPLGSFHLLSNSVLHQNDENTNLSQGQSEILQRFGTILTKRGEEELGESRDYEAAR